MSAAGCYYSLRSYITSSTQGTYRLVLTVVGKETLIINGQVGTNVTFKCSGWDIWTGVRSNVKYLCQSPCKEDQHIIIKAESGKTSHKDRIHLVNKGKKLFVTITDLQMSDSKKFLCGLERYGPDSFIEVDLKVKHGPEKTAKTVSVGSTVSFDAMSSSIMSFSSSDVITNMSPSYTILHITTPAASITSGAGSVPYLVISSIVIITIMLVLLTLMRKMKKQQMSSANSPQEDTQEAVEYDEIRTEYHQTERPPVAVSAIHASTDTDTETLYVNYFYHQGTELAAACGKYSASRSRVSPRGARAESRVTGPQNDLVYSAAQLSKQQIDFTGKSEPNQSESNEDCG